MQVTKSSVFLFLAAFLSLANAQRPLDNSLQLDPEGTFRLDFSVITNGAIGNASNPLIIFETHVKTRGFFLANTENII